MATIVFGLDGANWPLIEQWIDDGRLPNIKRLRKNGTWGTSESVLPPVTCPNWKCYASSRSPGHHDVYWWEHVDKNSLDIDIPDSKSFTAPEIWDYLNDEGYKTGVVNLPMSYPPREVDGFMIAGGPRSGEQDYTSPSEIEEEVERRFNYRVHPSNIITSNEDKVGVDATLDVITSRFETVRALLDEHELDFLHLTIFHLNVLQHYFYNGEPTRHAWEIIDEELGEFLNEGHNIFLMSDHGCTEIHTVFHINEWLKTEDYLSTKTTDADYLMQLGITQERLAKITRTIGIESTIRKYIPRRLIERFPDDEGIKRDQKFDKVIRGDSDAIASGQGLIYILHEPGSADYNRVVENIRDDILNLTTPQGTPLAKEVFTGEELYPDGNPRYRPDIIFDQGPGIHTSGAIGEKNPFDSPGQWRGENARNGLFLAYGPDITPSGQVGNISILDIAPTILASCGVDIPRDFEGKPSPDIVDQGTVGYRDPLPHRGEDTLDDSDDVKERLSDLGYLE